MIDIIFEDESLFVIDKPVGLASQPGEGVVGSVVSVLEKQLGRRVFPIHRLDKETAGCMMLAKDSAAASRWSKILGERQTHKRYIAICGGLPPQAVGVYRDALKTRERLQEAETAYRLVTSFGALSGGGAERGVEGAVQGETKDRGQGKPAFSLLEFRLGTGRTHQIRRHCAMHGHPIVGDDRYGDFSLNRKLKKEAGAKRLFLWAWGLELPGLGFITAAPPDHFIDFFRRWSDAPSMESLLKSLSARPMSKSQNPSDRRPAGQSIAHKEVP
ncbi:MAG: RluA family pseudouridine synthase [Spirochaetales bacterium]|nr:RluA family pseudouridine synthase [Spirochaetales bacterium]